MQKEQNILSLSNFLDQVQKLFNSHIANTKYIIKAEVNKIKLIKGFYYIDLVEIEDTGKIISKIRGTLFDSYEMNKFLKGAGLVDYNELTGKQIVFHGKANFHKDFGFSFNISSIDISYFLGEAELQKQKIIQELINEKIFDKNKLLTYSYPPFNIAVISSKNSEGLRDFEAILDNAKLNYSINYFYSNIHGDKSVPDILNALQLIINQNIQYKNNHTKEDKLKRNKYDFIAIIRGGGGVEGLNWANNKEIICLALKTNIPIITAIGHTSDKSILDIISKYPCKTPSEGAKIIIDIYDKYYDALINHKKGIDNILKHTSTILKNTTKNIYTDIQNQIINKIIYQKNQSKYIYLNINSLLKDKLFFYKDSINKFQEINLLINKKSYFYKTDLEITKNNINGLLKKHLSNLKHNLDLSYSIIKQHNYDTVFKKGYSLIFDKNNSKVITTLKKGNTYILKNKSGEYDILVE